MSQGPRVAIVGGGVTGLTTAHRLKRQGADVVLLESAPVLGGKIRTERFRGRSLDAGAEELVVRIGESLALCRELGLEDRLVAPATMKPFIWGRGRLRPLPSGLMSGLPDGTAALRAAGILSPSGLARAALDVVLPSRPLAHDVTIGSLVRARLGAEALERLVDPLLGGIHACSCDLLSVRAVAPQFEAAMRSGHGLVRGLRAAHRASLASAPDARRPAPAPQPTATKPAAAEPTGPPPTHPFMTLEGGLVTLIDALRAAADGVEIRTGAGVESIERRGDGRLRLRLRGDEPLLADQAVLAIPAYQAADLVRDACPAAAAELQEIEYSSVATVLLAYAPTALPAPLEGSGFLSTPSEGRTVTACTWESRKWAHQAGDLVVLKASAGRAGDRRALELPDTDLVARIHAELTQAMGLSEPPLEASVNRFERALPQYTLGHLDRIARAEAALSQLPGVHLAGAAYHGVGVSACIRDGERVAARVAATFTTS